MSSVKSKILKANENIKSTAILFSEIYNEIQVELDPALIENSNLALGELIKCIKHLALVQGEITGHELMPPEAKKELPDTLSVTVCADAMN